MHDFVWHAVEKTTFGAKIHTTVACEVCGEATADTRKEIGNAVHAASKLNFFHFHLVFFPRIFITVAQIIHFTFKIFNFH